jgi:nicotinamide-nucleotide amidase
MDTSTDTGINTRINTSTCKNQQQIKSLNAEIIAVGTELLLGDIVNSNAAWLSAELAQLGVSVYNHTVVGDNEQRIHSVLDAALDRANVLVFTGGLGPTEDDLTMSAIANYFQVPLVNDAASEARIAEFFVARGIQHSPSNLKQALRPNDATAIKNPMGTAPGIAWQVVKPNGKPALILTFPGVPREMKVMWPQGAQAIQAMQAKLGIQAQCIETASLHFFGIGESTLGEKLADVMAAANPTVAPYVGRSEVRVRLAAKADSSIEAKQLLEPVKTDIKTRLANYYFAEGDTADVADVVGELLIQQKKSVSLAESCTGGLVSSRLTGVAGASAYTTLNMVTYSNAQKHQQLGVPTQLLSEQGAVCADVAEAMAQGIQQKTGSDIGVSLTGVAGPTGGTDDKPVGLLWIALATSDMVTSKKVLVNATFPRQEIQYWFSQYALHTLRQFLDGND